MGTFVGGGRHCDGAARDDVGNNLMSGVTGEDYIWSFGVVREHPTDFFAGAEAYYAAYKSVDIAEWVMPVDGTVLGCLGRATHQSDPRTSTSEPTTKQPTICN